MSEENKVTTSYVDKTEYLNVNHLLIDCIKEVFEK